jgi:hypothetical protein
MFRCARSRGAASVAATTAAGCVRRYTPMGGGQTPGHDNRNARNDAGGGAGAKAGQYQSMHEKFATFQKEFATEQARQDAATAGQKAAGQQAAGMGAGMGAGPGTGATAADAGNDTFKSKAGKPLPGSQFREREADKERMGDVAQEDVGTRFLYVGLLCASAATVVLGMSQLGENPFPKLESPTYVEYVKPVQENETAAA